MCCAYSGVTARRPLGFVSLPLNEVTTAAQERWLDVTDPDGTVVGSINFNLWLQSTVPSTDATGPSGDATSAASASARKIAGAMYRSTAFGASVRAVPRPPLSPAAAAAAGASSPSGSSLVSRLPHSPHSARIATAPLRPRGNDDDTDVFAPKAVRSSEVSRGFASAQASNAMRLNRSGNPLASRRGAAARRQGSTRRGTEVVVSDKPDVEGLSHSDSDASGTLGSPQAATSVVQTSESGAFGMGNPMSRSSASASASATVSKRSAVDRGFSSPAGAARLVSRSSPFSTAATSGRLTGALSAAKSKKATGSSSGGDDGNARAMALAASLDDVVLPEAVERS